MNIDQIERLNNLADRVAEQFIDEANPDNWCGAGQQLKNMDSATRGDRYWDKKNAIQTGTLLARIIDLAERDKRAGGGKQTQASDAEKEVKTYEKQAAELLKRAQGCAAE